MSAALQQYRLLFLCGGQTHHAEQQHGFPQRFPSNPGVSCLVRLKGDCANQRGLQCAALHIRRDAVLFFFTYKEHSTSVGFGKGLYDQQPLRRAKPSWDFFDPLHLKGGTPAACNQQRKVTKLRSLE